MTASKFDKIVICGAAGLVGQNLSLLLSEAGFEKLVGIDKHPENVKTLRRLNPTMQVIEADLAVSGSWEDAFAGAKIVVVLQAQIGGEVYEEFIANNVRATERTIEASRRARVEYIVHISSSVINSKAKDYYTETKAMQEELMRNCGIPHCILRPTLMFGWFDRKHLGWLSRFMQKTPVFPIPGSGRYMRQPLYVRDFCRIIVKCVNTYREGTFEITGRERINYIDIIRSIKRILGLRTSVVRIPYGLFWILLKTYALFDRNPPFTTKQLEALVTPDEFELIPWWEIFQVESSPLESALVETYKHEKYAKVVLEF